MTSKPTLRIAHLYADLMNIYGDWGNIASLVYRATRRGFEVKVDAVSIGDDLKSNTYNFYFFGGGQDAGQMAVAHDLPRLASIIKDDIDNGAALLSICGGYQLLGQSYSASDGSSMPGISLLPVTTVAHKQRFMNNSVIAINPNLDIDRQQSSTLVGFENHSGRTELLPEAQALGRVIKGNGNNGHDSSEGVVYKHAIGTYLHGSCLPKNPHLADWLLYKALTKDGHQIELEPLDDQVEWQAHHAAAKLKP